MPAPETSHLSADLLRFLTESSSLNEFMASALPRIAEAFGACQLVLVDYRETTDRFELIHFHGCSGQTRSDLQRALHGLDLRSAILRKTGYDDGEWHILPLRFAQALEAVLVLSAAPVDPQIEPMVSKFLGLLMSSNRLSINRSGQVDSTDLRRAREIQLSYLPRSSFEDERFEIYGHNQSAAVVGGDYFDYFPHPDGTMVTLLADASGHGMSAALIMSAFRALVHTHVAALENPGRLWSVVNSVIHSTGETIQYLTGVVMQFDPVAGILRYTNAGHFEPLVVRSSGEAVSLPGGGPPLGMFKATDYPTLDAPLAGGDLVVLFTDGFPDLLDAEGNYFGTDRISRTVVANRTEPLHRIAERLIAEAAEFSGRRQPEDDLTLFLLRRR